jgi:hypothetical protein
MQDKIGKYITILQDSSTLSIKFKRNIIVSIGVFIPLAHLLFVGLTIYLALEFPASKFYYNPIFIIIVFSLPIAVWTILSELSVRYEILLANHYLSLIITRLNKQRIQKIPLSSITNVQKIYTLTRIGAGEGTRWPTICFFVDSEKYVIPISFWDDEVDELLKLISRFIEKSRL